MTFLPRQFLCHVSTASVFIKIGLKLIYFCKKIQNFWALDSAPKPPELPQPYCRFLVMRLSLTMFLLISMPPEFSLMPRFKSIIFIKISPKLGYFCKKKFLSSTRDSTLRPQMASGGAYRPPKQPLPLQYFSYALYTKRGLPRCCSCFQVIES